MSVVTGACGNVTLTIGGVPQVFNTHAHAVKEEVDMRPATTYVDGKWKRFKPGLKGWTASISMYADDTVGTSCLGELAHFKGTTFDGVEQEGDCWVQSIDHENTKDGDALVVINVLGEGELSKTPAPSPSCTECP